MGLRFYLGYEGDDNSVVMTFSTGGKLLDGMQCTKRCSHCTQGSTIVYFYPKPAELRRRLDALKSSPPPPYGEDDGYNKYRSPFSISEAECFVRAYEKAFAEHKTDWQEVLHPVHYDEMKAEIAAGWEGEKVGDLACIRPDLHSHIAIRLAILPFAKPRRVPGPGGRPYVVALTLEYTNPDPETLNYGKVC